MTDDGSGSSWTSASGHVGVTLMSVAKTTWKASGARGRSDFARGCLRRREGVLL